MRALAPFLALVIFFVSCNPCKNTNCMNGGTCEDGNCNCVSPYGGKNCETNLCENVVCHNGGSCYNGSCACAAGYEGAQCDSLVTAKFVGSFSCLQACSIDTAYAVTVSSSGPPSANDITFFSLNNYQPVAVVNAYTLTIQFQTTPTGQTLIGSGKLSLNQDTITLSMTVIPFGSTMGTTCSYTLTRK